MSLAIGSTGKKNMLDVVDMGITGGWDWGFNGGLQIDMYGNINMIGIGTYPQVKVRGPGTVGTIWTGTLRRPYRYTMHHAPRVLVEKCDYVSGPGYNSGGNSRWDKVQNTTEGPQLLFTPMAILDFDPDSKRMRLKSVHPGYSADDVQKTPASSWSCRKRAGRRRADGGRIIRAASSRRSRRCIEKRPRHRRLDEPARPPKKSPIFPRRKKLPMP